MTTPQEGGTAEQPPPEAVPERPIPAPEPDVPPPPTAPPASINRLLVASAGVLAVVAILLGLMVFAPASAPIKLGATRLAARAQAEQNISNIARRFANNFLRISYRTLDADADRIAKDATTDFAQRIRRALQVGKDRLAAVKGVSTGNVSDVTVLTHSGDAASVRVVATRTISNNKTRTPRSVVVTMDLTLIRTVNGWKVSNAAGEGTAPTS